MKKEKIKHLKGLLEAAVYFMSELQAQGVDVRFNIDTSEWPYTLKGFKATQEVGNE